MHYRDTEPLNRHFYLCSCSDIEDLTRKTGNFKQFPIFCSMLESAVRKVRLTLDTERREIQWFHHCTLEQRLTPTQICSRLFELRRLVCLSSVFALECKKKKKKKKSAPLFLLLSTSIHMSAGPHGKSLEGKICPI